VSEREPHLPLPGGDGGIKRIEEYVHTPKTGDVYEVRTQDNYYTLLKIVSTAGSKEIDNRLYNYIFY